MFADKKLKVKISIKLAELAKLKELTKEKDVELERGRFKWDGKVIL